MSKIIRIAQKGDQAPTLQALGRWNRRSRPALAQEPAGAPDLEDRVALAVAALRRRLRHVGSVVGRRSLLASYERALRAELAEPPFVLPRFLREGGLTCAG